MRHYRELRALIRRAVNLARHEGPASLARHAFSFLAFLFHRVYMRRDVYLYEHSLEARDRSLFLPRLESWELRIIHSDADADTVAAEGLEDLRESYIYASRSLDWGAIVFCVYVERRLAHVGWVAVSERGKNAVDRMPFRVSFDACQACTGGTYTRPEYRGKGLMAYGYFERFEYLRTHGFTSSRNSVEVRNVSSQKAHAKFNPTIYGRGKYRKVLRWVTWRTEGLPGGPRRGMPPDGTDGHDEHDHGCG